MEIRSAPGPLSEVEEIRGAAVALRRWRRPDASAVALALTDRSIQRDTFWPHTPTTAEVMSLLSAADERRCAGVRCELALVELELDDPVGAAGIELQRNGTRAEVFYWLAPWARGRGMATRAVELLVRHAFDHVGVGEVRGVVRSHNLRSQNVLLRAGFVARELDTAGFRIFTRTA